jgi:CheY-like chemotaxis protein
MTNMRTDVQMPVLDGVETTRQIRASPQPKRQVAILALTAHTMTGAKEEYIAAGMDDFVTQPIELALLLRKARTLAGGSLLGTAHAEPVVAEAEHDDDYGPVFDPARFEALGEFLRSAELRASSSFVSGILPNAPAASPRSPPKAITAQWAASRTSLSGWRAMLVGWNCAALARRSPLLPRAGGSPPCCRWRRSVP